MGLIREVRSGICAAPGGSTSPMFVARSSAHQFVVPLPNLSILCHPQFPHLGADPTRSGRHVKKRHDIFYH